MTNGLSPAGLIARSAAFARSLAPRKPFPFRQRRGGVTRALKPASLLLAVASPAGNPRRGHFASTPTAEAQNATITSLLSRLDVEGCDLRRLGLRMRDITRPIPGEA